MYSLFSFLIYYFQVQKLLILLFPMNYRRNANTALLEVIVHMKNIDACSFHGNKTVHFISMSCVVIFWTANICYVFYPVTGSLREM